MRRNREVENERKGLSHFVAGAGAAVRGMVSAEHCGRSSWNDEDTSVRFPGKRVGIFGYSLSRIFTRCLMKKYPETVRQMEIEVKDERNAAIASRAKAKAFDLMIFVFGILMVIFALINIRMEAILLFVAAYLFVAGYGIYWRFKYEREM